MKEAFLYERQEEKKVRCFLCAHYCLIGLDKKGRCRVRQNVNGSLYSLVYGKLIAQHVDPIEKKPLFHFLPGSLSYSIATAGCNFRCRHCQNADIAQMPRDQDRIIGREVAPRAVVAEARASGCLSVSYTYTEPTIFGEYVFDVAELAHREGLKNVAVTNGYLSPEAIARLGPVLDAANVDLKAFSEGFYHDICGAKLAPVLEALKGLRAAGVWLEVTTLLIPGLNDSPAELKELTGWLAAELGPEVPWHVSRFHPTYRLTDRPPTPLESLQQAFEIGLEAGLKHVYLGNVPGRGGETTSCAACGALLIDRWGFSVSKNRLRGGACPDCGRPLAGVF